MSSATESSRYLERPNFLVILVDEERYPPIYEHPEIREWGQQNLVTQQLLKSHSLEFHRHYIGTTACCPSRATLFTDHYPSLHGVSQTIGIAKEAFDSNMNSAHPTLATQQTRNIQQWMKRLLAELRDQKRLTPAQTSTK
ncbi:sulfatase-like hydrolase/transferase [Paenibacillus sp.]|uniref:sulfatase-like hydrolase/transferase n=1 Tax=Paenibacillus sp. TaxID=58172 RepID=UPI0028A79E0F|nr:sulfatase-like hydrolase/transferase [Paenibacillus sp.]